VNAVLTSEDFTLEKVKAASNALVAIHKWVSAMMSYHELLKIVGPKREKVAEMNAKLAVVRASLAEKRKKLEKLRKRSTALSACTERKSSLRLL
jgi:dynein heavy chain